MRNTPEQIALNLDHSKENVPRQITSTMPVRGIWPITHRATLSEQIKNKEKYAYVSPERKFDFEGVKGVVEREEDAFKAAVTMASYRYTITNHHLADSGSGLYSMVTTNQGLYDVKEVGTRDRQGIFTPTGARIVCSSSTLWKAMFGPLVNHNGNAIDGAGDIVRKAKEKIMPILNGTMPTPRAYASIKKTVKQEDGSLKKVEAIVSGSPITVYRQVTGARDAYIIDIDYSFFPMQLENNIFKAVGGEPFIHRVAGQSAFLQLGSMLERRSGNQFSIKIDTAIKILTAAQAVFEMSYFAPGIVKENNSGRVNISLRRDAIRDICPSVVNSTTGRIDFQAASYIVAQTGKIFNRAIDYTGIRGELLKLTDRDGKPRILIPARSQGAEFPHEYPGTVYIKVDRMR